MQFKIGEVASRASVSVQTILYYERKGILPSPARSAANYRLYSEEAVRRIRFVKSAQTLGFALAEIKELLALHGSHDATCNVVREKLRRRMASVDEKLSSLKAIRQDLERLIEQCPGDAPVSECPVIELLGSNGIG